MFESGEFATYHLSGAILDSEAPKGKNVRVVARLDKEKEITVAVLGASNMVATLDLYFNSSQQMAIALAKDTPKGTSVSLSGYFEPKSTDMDDDLFYGQEDEAEEDDDLNDDEDDDLEDSEEEKPSSKSKKDKLTLEQKLKNAKENSNKNATTTFGNMDDSEDSDEDEKDADDLEDLSDESEIEDDIADEDDESDDEAPAKPAGHTKKSAKVVADDDSEDDQSEAEEEVAVASDSEDSDEEEVSLENLMKQAAKKAKV